MSEMLYAKFNRTRNPRFQTGTEIIVRGGERFVRKKPLTPEAKEHILSYERKYEINKNLYCSIEPIKGNREGDVLLFPYLEGESLKNRIDKQKEDITALCKTIAALLQQELAYQKEALCDFACTEEFVNVFGEAQGYEGQAVRASDIDVTFDNVIRNEEGLFLIDCEWTFAFPIPVKYINYRRLYWFFHNEETYFTGKLSEEAFMKTFDIEEEELRIFRDWERSFQFYVYGDNACYAYPARYLKPSVDLKKLAKEHGNMEQELLEKELRIEHLEKQVKELRQQHEAMVQSASWKMTAPLRKIMDGIGGSQKDK